MKDVTQPGKKHLDFLHSELSSRSQCAASSSRANSRIVWVQVKCFGGTLDVFRRAARRQRTIDTALAFGFTRIELTVRETNVNAISFYKKLGFETEGLH